MREIIVSGGPTGPGYTRHVNGRLQHVRGYRAHTNRGPSKPRGPRSASSAPTEGQAFADAERELENEARDIAFINPKHEVAVKKRRAAVAKREAKLDKLEAKQAKLDAKEAAIAAKRAKLDVKDAIQDEKLSRERIAVDRSERGVRRTLISFLTGGNKETPVRNVRKNGRLYVIPRGAK